MLKYCFARVCRWTTGRECDPQAKKTLLYSLYSSKNRTFIRFFDKTAGEKKTNMNYKVINMMNSFCICLKNIQIAIEPLS